MIPRRSFSALRLAALACLLGAAFAGTASAQIFPWQRRPTPTPEPAPPVRRATPARPKPTPEATTEEGVPVRRAFPAPGSDGAEVTTPEDLNDPPTAPRPGRSNPSTSPPVRRAVPVTAPAVPRPPEPGEAAAPPEDGTTIRLTPSTGGAPAATPEQVQLELANNFYARKQYREAAAEYEKFLANFSSGTERPGALYRLAECQRLTNRAQAAATTYRNLLLETRESGEFAGPAAYRLGVTYYAQKDFRAAYPLFQRSSQLARAADVKLASLYYQALCLENMERRVETREVYERIAETPGENPYREYARGALARLAFLDGRKNEALRQYELLAREATKDSLKADATLKAALLAADLGLPDTALPLLQKAADWPGDHLTVAQKNDARLGILRVHYRTGQYARVLAAWQEVGSNFTGDNRADALLMAANSHKQLKQTTEALEMYATILKEFPKSPQAADVSFQRVAVLYATNDPGLGKAVDEFLARNPEADKADKARLIRAEILFNKPDYAAAAAAYGQVQESVYIEPRYRAEATYRVGYCMTQLKQPERVVEAFTRFLRAFHDHPLAPKAVAQRGLAYQQLRNYPAALADFNGLLIDFPKAKERELALQQKALLLGQSEDAKGMSDTFRLLLKEFPQSAAAGMANYWIGRTEFEAKNFAGATPFLAAGKGDKEFGARAWLLLLLCHYNAKEFEKLDVEAGAYLAAKNQPQPPPALMSELGNWLFERREYAKAEPYLFGAASSPSSPSADTWLVLARCRRFIREWPGALDAAQKYLESKPAAPAARAQGLLEAGEAYVGLQKLDDAQRHAEQALALAPAGALNAEGRLLLGQVQMARGDAAGAAKDFLAVAVLFDDPEITPRALSLAAEALAKAGKNEDAKKALEEMRTRFPGYAAARAK